MGYDGHGFMGIDLGIDGAFYLGMCTYIYIYNNNIHRYRALVMDLHTGYIQFQRNKNHLHCLSCKIALIPRTENPFEANRSPIIIGGKTVLIHMTRTKASENVNISWLLNVLHQGKTFLEGKTC